VLKFAHDVWEKGEKYEKYKQGDHSNYFHRNLVRPNTEKLLNIKEGDFVLDIACGNGNFSQRLAQNGARTTRKYPY
jgi:2-polyprenyl-3-methyl-5-hydroxy-6-metoxy-1,4-benzoquinol methylase